MKRASDRSVLSRASPKNIWRLARFVGLDKDIEECECIPCMLMLVEWLAREMEKV